MSRFVLLLFLFLPVVTWATERPSQLGFADSLTAEGDHYRAITEYRRFIFEQPDSPLVPQARLAIIENLLAGKRWAQADSNLEDLFVLHPQSPEAAKGRQIYADSAYERGAFGLARERYRALQKQELTPVASDYANFRIGWTFLEEGRPAKARSTFSLLPQEQKSPLLEELDNYQSLALKSPRLAGTLSAVLPGLGQAYTGRYRQAALSFLLNGAFILGALEAFDDQNYAVGGILLFFELGWYGGNIYNATNNAHKYNERAQHQFKEQMHSRFNLGLGLQQRTPLVTLNYRF